jgi:putative ABC transport system ATP-binding protein
MALVEVRNVSKSFQREAQSVVVYDGLTIEFAVGSYTALMGPSGSGKSTLLNLVAGLDRPTSGSVIVDGEIVSEMNASQLAAWRSRTIGFVFQSYNLLPVLTAQQNVELPLLLTNLNRKERAERTAIALGVVGLADRMDHYPRQLSGGQEQRVAIARAIVADPKLILLDEPTGQLDAKSTEEVLDLLSRLNAEFGKTIMMVTHDPRAAERATSVLHLDKGALLERQMAAV